MKNSIRIFALVSLCAASLGIMGCSKFLSEEPQSQYSMGTFYKTPSDFEIAIAGVYAGQQELYNNLGGVFRMAITRSDDTKVGAGYVDQNDKFLDDATGSYIQNLWQELYIVVSRANAIITRIDGVEFEDETMKKAIKGEALALRSWAYYQLGVSFGGVPLFDKEYSTAEVKTIKRSTQAETFAFAAEGYTTAIGLLPTEWTGKSVGRITKYAAEAGLARLYMFQSKFSEAKTLLGDIITSGKYDMAEKYEDCFDDAFNNTKERVWEIQFTNGGLGEGNILPNSFMPDGYHGTLTPFTGASAFLEVSQDLVAAYEPGDLRKDQSIVADVIVGSAPRTGWYISKWLHYTAVPVNNNDFAINLPVVRYTDVLLMYAECLNEAGYSATGDAFKYINKVRGRAGLSPLTAATTPDQAAFRKAMMQERRVEFAFEGLRWLDLVRWGKAVEVMDAFLKQPENENGLYKMGTTDRYLYAIPSQEIANYNDKSIMWQNDGF